MKDWAYQAMHDAAMALPPSDFGSHRACEAAAKVLRSEREACAQIALEAAATCDENGEEADVWVALKIADLIRARLADATP